MCYVNCNLCPRGCGVDRTAGELGFCGCPDVAVVAKTMLHKWEEPALAGSGGSGAVFFGGCTLKCKYCQNAAISSGAVGKAMDSGELRQLFEDLICQGAENIDLVTPTHFLPTILPALTPKPPLLREHRLYQADWLMRFYHFDATELLDSQNPNFDPYVDPKCGWALRHLEQFPVEVNRADYELLLRVPGIGVKSARRILTARKTGSLDFDGLKKLGVVLKRAKYFVLCRGKAAPGIVMTHQAILRALLSDSALDSLQQGEQISLFDPTMEDVQKCITGQI